MNNLKLAFFLGSEIAPTGNKIRFYEIGSDERLFVSRYDVGKILGYKGNSTSGRKTAPSLLDRALVASKNPPVKCLISSTTYDAWLLCIDLNVLPLSIQKFVEFLVNAPKIMKKYNLYFDNAFKLLDWLDNKIIPVFYENACADDSENQSGKKTFDNKAYMKEWHKNHPDYQRQWRANNRERVREYNRQWRKANPDYQRQWFLRNRDRVLAYQRKYDAQRRAKKKTAQTSLFAGTTP